MLLNDKNVTRERCYKQKIIPMMAANKIIKITSVHDRVLGEELGALWSLRCSPATRDHRGACGHIVDDALHCMGVGTHVRASLTSVLLPRLPIYSGTEFSHSSFKVQILNCQDTLYLKSEVSNMANKKPTPFLPREEEDCLADDISQCQVAWKPTVSDPAAGIFWSTMDQKYFNGQEGAAHTWHIDARRSYTQGKKKSKLVSEDGKPAHLPAKFKQAWALKALAFCDSTLGPQIDYRSGRNLEEDLRQHVVRMRGWDEKKTKSAVPAEEPKKPAAASGGEEGDGEGDECNAYGGVLGNLLRDVPKEHCQACFLAAFRAKDCSNSGASCSHSAANWWNSAPGSKSSTSTSASTTVVIGNTREGTACPHRGG